jgi:hypothetical protein
VRSSILGLSARIGAIAALGHELIELSLVLCKTQAIEEVAKLALLLFQPFQGVGPIFVK